MLDRPRTVTLTRLAHKIDLPQIPAMRWGMLPVFEKQEATMVAMLRTTVASTVQMITITVRIIEKYVASCLNGKRFKYCIYQIYHPLSLSPGGIHDTITAKPIFRSHQ